MGLAQHFTKEREKESHLDLLFVEVGWQPTNKYLVGAIRNVRGHNARYVYRWLGDNFWQVHKKTKTKRG